MCWRVGDGGGRRRKVLLHGRAGTHALGQASHPASHSPTQPDSRPAMQHANINSHPLATVRLHAYGSSSVLRALLSVRCLVRHSPSSLSREQSTTSIYQTIRVLPLSPTHYSSQFFNQALNQTAMEPTRIASQFHLKGCMGLLLTKSSTL